MCFCLTHFLLFTGKTPFTGLTQQLTNSKESGLNISRELAVYGFLHGMATDFGIGLEGSLELWVAQRTQNLVKLGLICSKFASTSFEQSLDCNKRFLIWEGHMY